MRIGTAFRTAFLVAIILAASVFASRSLALSATASTMVLDQGAKWTSANRKDFYSLDRGLRIMPLAWMQGLALSNGESCIADNTVRNTHLPNPQRIAADLCLGLNVVSSGDGQRK